MSATFEITGTTIAAPKEQTGQSNNGKDWRKMSLVVEHTEKWKGGSRTHHVEVTAFGDYGCDKLSQVNAGDDVKIIGTIGGTLKKDGSGAWVNLNVQSVEVLGRKAPEFKPKGKSPSAHMSDDDIRDLI